jgi:hypothetical protein
MHIILYKFTLLDLKTMFWKRKSPDYTIVIFRGRRGGERRSSMKA